MTPNPLSELGLTGFVLGLGAGLAPGPMLALVIAESLRGGYPAGARVAVVPLITDAPIILAVLALAGFIARYPAGLAGLAWLGAAVLLHLAADTWRGARRPPGPQAGAAVALRRGLLVNLLNPHPWLFWLTVGVPLLAGARQGAAGVALFLVAFYVALVGSKLVLAGLVARAGGALDARAWRWIMRALALALVAVAVLLARDGLRLATGG